MTRHEKLLAELILGKVHDISVDRAVQRLFELGLINQQVCERMAICAEVEKLERQSIPRCEALHVVAETFCCSYEKARGAFYNQYKS